MVKIINKPIGRPNIELDYNTVFELGKIQCTISECAAVIGCDEGTLRNSTEFNDTLKKGAEVGRKSLRRLQFAKAEGQDAKIYVDSAGKEPKDDKGRPIVIQPGYAPDTTMQIWLGKQQLGQTDQINVNRQEVAVTVLHKEYEKGKKEKEEKPKDE